MNQRLAAVLFDLDGTLMENRPDLAVSATAMRADFGRAPLLAFVLDRQLLQIIT